MNARIPALPAVLPSRRAHLNDALQALEQGAPVFITGDPGAGLTTFGQMLLTHRAKAGRRVHRITGFQALTEVPFGVLAAVAAQIPGLVPPEGSATGMITEIATQGLHTPRTFFIDHASHIDVESAAALTHLWPNIELIVASSHLAGLPHDLRRLAYEHGSVEIALTSIDLDDARVLLEDLLYEPHNASTVNTLFNLSGGNPMYLRELAIDADQRGSLLTVNGYRTLDASWKPSGRRLLDLLRSRFADQPEQIRQAVNLITLTGPLAREASLRLIEPETLVTAVAEGLLEVSAQNRKKDIAQSFDGPGAEAELHHPEELVQLGAGLTFDLVLATLSPRELTEHAALIRERLTGVHFSTSTQLHLKGAFSRLGLPYEAPTEERATADASPNGDDLREVVWRITNHLHSGAPSNGIELFAEHLHGPAWDAASSTDRTVFIQAMYLAMIGEGSRLDAFDHHFTSIDWHDLALDHGVFLTGRGDLFLELGNATEAAELFAQALGILTMQDATGIAGFTAGLDAVAASMTGDVERARTQLETYRRAPASSGSIARAEAERLTLFTTLTLEGRDTAQQQLESLLDRAAAEGHRFLQMRLLHDAWRLRLVDEDDIPEHLARLSQVAGEVEGRFAEILSQYAAAFADLMGGTERVAQPASQLSGEPRSNGDPHPSVEAVAMQHLETGRALFAAEVAARGAELAHRLGDRRQANALLGVFAQATPMLEGVNTPSLGRARVDPELLSERELEVCLAALDGKTNTEIATALFLSPRTVEGHLQRAYTKLGITDRRLLLPLREDSR